MRIAGVDIPEALLDAQEGGRLVIFAGAGVSIPPPSNYPNFDGLAEKIAEGAIGREELEPIDRYLGRMVDRGIKVHERARRILSDPNSLPGELHIDLIRLFSASSGPRLVTTNFDVHFTTAAKKLTPSGKELNVFTAPALPLGANFDGLVYLHGNVGGPPDRMVLTDADFGRAYLTEGWATRFLQELFTGYVVLFVGYSHQDPVMNYLARGLPTSRGQGRFALTEAGIENHWLYRGITPVSYPLGTGGNKHSAVGAVISGWAALARTGALEREEKIRTITCSPFPLEQESVDYLERALKNISTARFFARHARGIDWLRWVEQKELLSSLFDAAPITDSVIEELGFWFVENFIHEFPSDSLALVQRQGQRLNAVLWFQVARVICNKKPRLGPDFLATWVCLLMNSCPPGGGRGFLDYILNSLQFPEHKDLSVLLFGRLTKPMGGLRKSIWGDVSNSSEKRPIRVELSVEGSDYWLHEVWQKLFRPNLGAFADDILWMVVSQLNEACLILRATEEAAAGWDPISFSRSTVEDSGFGAHQNGFGVLIDAARELLDWNLTNRPAVADSLVDLWAMSEAMILRRLALYGVAKAGHWDAAKKLAWVLRKGFLFGVGLKHELFMVLKDAYPRALEVSRRALLDRVREAMDFEGEGRPREYEFFNLCHWLHQSAPDCHLAKALVDELRAKHPEFGPRERPDLDVVLGPVQWGRQSPVGVEELLSKPAEDQVAFLRDFVPASPLGADRETLMAALSETVSKSTPWGITLARALKEQGVWKPDLWSAVLSGLSRAELNCSQWEELLALLERNKEICSICCSEISSLLENGMKGSSHQIPFSALALARKIASACWDTSLQQPEVDRRSPDDWMFPAINHAAVSLAMFWLYCISRARNEPGVTWDGIPPDYGEVLEKIVNENSYAAQLARVIFLSRLVFLFSSDEVWTVKTLVPVLDWSVSAERAEPAWHGFLAGGWTDRMVPLLLPFYEKSVPLLATKFGRTRQAFCNHLAGIACFSSTNPVTHGWLHRFMGSAVTEDRTAWASAVRLALREMSEEARRNAWERWIGEYWEKRVEGIPVPLDGMEAGTMLEWLSLLGENFPQAAEKVMRGPVPVLAHSFFYRELRDTDLPDRYARAAVKLVYHLLRSNCETPVYEFEVLEGIVRRGIAAGGEQEDLLGVCDELARLGDPQAAGLKREVSDASSE